jgi:hypothetical protein
MIGVSGGQYWLLGAIVGLGLLASLAAFPAESLSLPTRLSTIVALGYASLGLCAAVLVIAERLTAGSYLA